MLILAFPVTVRFPALLMPSSDALMFMVPPLIVSELFDLMASSGDPMI